MKTDRELTPSRVTVARERRGYTKTALARLTGLSSKTITNIELGNGCSEETLKALAHALQFPVGFFYREDLVEPLNPSFRAFSRVTAAQKKAAQSSGAIAFELGDWLAENFNLPEPKIPDYSNMEPEAAAQALRLEWRLGFSPIKNMIHLLESKGVKVFSLAEENAEVNAFCCWHKSTDPYVFLNSFKSSESSRFDAAHELAHLVLHRYSENKGKEAEAQADAFAGEFLMPRQGVLSRKRAYVQLRDILKEKKYWNVSAFAMTYTMSRNHMLTEWRYRALCIEMSKLGYRKTEPDSEPHERSQILQKVIDFYRPRGGLVPILEKELNIHREEINKLIFNIAPTMSVTDSPKKSAAPKPKLTLVN